MNLTLKQHRLLNNLESIEEYKDHYSNSDQLNLFNLKENEFKYLFTFVFQHVEDINNYNLASIVSQFKRYITTIVSNYDFKLKKTNKDIPLFAVSEYRCDNRLHVHITTHELINECVDRFEHKLKFIFDSHKKLITKYGMSDKFDFNIDRKSVKHDKNILKTDSALQSQSQLHSRKLKVIDCDLKILKEHEHNLPIYDYLAKDTKREKNIYYSYDLRQKIKKNNDMLNKILNNNSLINKQTLFSPLLRKIPDNHIQGFLNNKQHNYLTHLNQKIRHEQN